MIVALYFHTFLLRVFYFCYRRFTTHPAQDPMDWISKRNPDTMAMGIENHPVTFVSQTMDNDNQHQAPDIRQEQNNVDFDDQKQQFSSFTSLPTVYLHKIHVHNKEDI